MTSVAFSRSLFGMVETPATAARDACIVRLVDRRTGGTHRINGSPLTILTRNPAEAAAALLNGRDPAVWEARVEPIGKAGRA